MVVYFTVANASTGATISSGNTTVVCPEDEDTYVYYRWTVPKGLNGTAVTVTATAVYIPTGYTMDVGVLQNKTCTYDSVTASDETYAEYAPSWYTSGATSPVTSGDSTATSAWYVWKYTDDTFTKVEYSLKLTASVVYTYTSYSDDANTYSSSTIKSGYGIFSGGSWVVTNTSATSLPSGSFTPVQYGYMLLPEYNYSTEYAETFMPTLSTSTGTIYGELRKWYNTSKLTVYHYIPIWYPDGVEYTIAYYLTDCWTPTGMLQAAVNGATFTVDGDMYDDWYIGRLTD